MPIVWETGIELEGIPTSLTATLDEAVTVGMRVDEDGDFIVSFVCGIRGDRHDLNGVEAWIRRMSRILNDEDVE